MQFKRLRDNHCIPCSEGLTLLNANVRPKSPILQHLSIILIHIFLGFYLFLQVQFPLSLASIKYKHFQIFGWGKFLTKVASFMQLTGVMWQEPPSWTRWCWSWRRWPPTWARPPRCPAAPSYSTTSWTSSWRSPSSLSSHSTSSSCSGSSLWVTALFVVINLDCWLSPYWPGIRRDGHRE